MKTLAIIRHAKSDWENEALSDFHRPLNVRGNSDAPEMAMRTKKAGYFPDLIITSPALRAYSTALYFASALCVAQQRLHLQEELYESDEKTYLKVISQTKPEVQTLFVFGHNPSVTALCNKLGDLTTDNVPTCGMVIFSLTIDRWSEVKHGIAKLLLYDFPKRVK